MVGAVSEGERAARTSKEQFAELGLAMEGVQQSAELVRQTFGRTLTAYKEQESAARRLEATAQLTGTSLDRMRKQSAEAAETLQLSSRQADELTIGLTKLTSRAGETERTGEAMKQLLDVAAAQGYNAQQALEAINQALKGQDEGTDKLFQKNPSRIYEQWAEEAGVAAAKMNETQKAQALLNEITTTANQVGDEYIDYLQESEGRQAVFNAQIEDAQAALGSLVADALGPMLFAGTEALELFNALPDEVQRVIGTTGALLAVIQSLRVSGLIPTSATLSAFSAKLKAIPAQAAAANGGLAALTAGFRAAGAAAKGFFASLGPIGWLTVAIGVAAEAWAYLSTETEEATDAAAKWKEQMDNFSVVDLRMKIDDLGTTLEKNKRKMRENREEIERLQQAMLDAESFKEANQYTSNIKELKAENRALANQNDTLKERRKAYKKQAKERRKEREERRKAREKERRADEQAKQRRKLRVERLEEGIEQERQKLKAWYAEQKKLAEGSKENLALVEEVYNKRRAQLRQKRQKAQREAHIAQQEARLELMKEGQDKRLAQIDLAFDKRLQKYREKYAETAPDLVAAYEERQEKVREAVKRSVQDPIPVPEVEQPDPEQLAPDPVEITPDMFLKTPDRIGEELERGMLDSISEVDEALRLVEEKINNAETDEARSELRNLQNELENTRDSLQATGEGARDIGPALQEGLADSIASVMTAIGEGKNVGEALMETLASLAQRIGKLMIGFGTAALKLQTLITNPIGAIAAGAALVALGSAAKSAVSREVNQDTGGYQSGTAAQRAPDDVGADLPGRAEGGPVAAGRAYIVGEEGEELMIPNDDGVVLPNRVTRDVQAAMRALPRGAPRGPAQAPAAGGSPRQVEHQHEIEVEGNLSGRDIHLAGKRHVSRVEEVT